MKFYSWIEEEWPIKKTKIGIVGCGNISGIYLKNLTHLFTDTEIIGVCDLIPERAEKAYKEYNLPKLYKDMHELCADGEVDIVLNLTRPYEHHEVNMTAINAGKHVYVEKPLGATLEEGIESRDAAQKKGVLIGGAPDTFLGAGIQTCRKLLDDGYIGKPIAATGFWGYRGHESWHPDPESYYQFGGGPILDMGPYYITAMISLLGEVDSVNGMIRKTFETRRITSQPKYGEVFKVEVPTLVTGQMAFASGAVGTIMLTYDIHAHKLPIIEIYGTEGTLSVPDPNTFAGPALLYRDSSKSFMEIPLTFDYTENSRGLGVADMARAAIEKDKPRAGVDLTFHALEIMTGLIRSGEQNAPVEIKSGFTRPVPMKSGLLPGKV